MQELNIPNQVVVRQLLSGYPYKRNLFYLLVDTKLFRLTIIQSLLVTVLIVVEDLSTKFKTKKGILLLSGLTQLQFINELS